MYDAANGTFTSADIPLVPYAELTAAQREAMSYQEQLDYLQTQRDQAMAAEAAARGAADPTNNPAYRPQAPDADTNYIYYYAWIGGSTSGSWTLYRASNTAENQLAYGSRSVGGETLYATTGDIKNTGLAKQAQPIKDPDGNVLGWTTDYKMLPDGSIDQSSLTGSKSDVSADGSTIRINGVDYKLSTSAAGATAAGAGTGAGTGTGFGATGTGTSNSQYGNVGQTAVDIINGFLTEAGMGALSPDVWKQWTSGTTAAQIMEYIRKTPQYAERFPAMAALNKAGRNISEAQYIYKETADIELMKQYGIPSGIFDNKKFLGSLIENNVNVVELQKRLIAAQDTVMSFDPSIVKYAKDTYGLDTGSLMAWALAPNLALPIIEQQAKAIQIGGAAFAAGLSAQEITKTEAEKLASAGVTQDQAKQGFTNVAQQGQYKADLPGITNPAETLTNEELINAQFAVDPQAMIKLQKARQSKLATYQEGGQYASTQGGLVGIGSAPSV
jgi:hypothetical protein